MLGFPQGLTHFIIRSTQNPTEAQARKAKEEAVREKRRVRSLLGTAYFSGSEAEDALDEEDEEEGACVCSCVRVLIVNLDR